jgi:probable HAF family extracellular repeat protein
VHNALPALALPLLMALSTQAAGAPPMYRVTDLGALPGDSFSLAWDVNDQGQAVGLSGEYAGSNRPVIFKTGTVRAIEAEAALSINGKGWITGYGYVPGASNREAFVLKGNTMTYLGSLGTDPIYASSYGYAINAAGHVTGVTDVGDGSQRHAFIHDGRRMRSLGTLGGDFSGGHAINRWDWVAGSSNRAVDGTTVPFLYRGGAMRDLCALTPRACSGEALGLNNRGWVTGHISFGGVESVGFVYDGKTLRRLPGMERGNAINAEGWVVGYSPFGRGPANQPAAVLYDGNAVHDLNTLIRGPGQNKWYLTFAQSINGNRQIVGVGFPSKWNTRVRHAFLLTPVVDTAAPRTDSTGKR